MMLIKNMQSLFSYNISLSLVLMAVSVFAFIIAVFYFPYAPSAAAASTNFQIVYWAARFLLGLGGIAGFIIGFEGFDTTMRAELK